MDVKRIQEALRSSHIDGWLLCDFRNREYLAYLVLGLNVEKPSTRRWYYFIPSRGEPKKLVHSVERAALEGLPGSKKEYVSWKELHASLKRLLGAKKTIAMQYSPRNHVPYVSMVDAGTVELVRSFGHKVVSSADLVQRFVSVIDERGYQLHKQAGAAVDVIRGQAFDEITRAIREGSGATEYDVQQFIMRRFAEEHLTTYAPPMVGVNDHPADPHFEVTRENARTFKRGDTVLIDMWAKSPEPGGIYYDITWVGYIGEKPPAKYVEIYSTVRDARDAAIDFVVDRIDKGRPCFGWEVDDVCRAVVVKAGYGKHFLHRTGHAIDEEIHGKGVNIDNLETRDERQLIPGCCFSIEPGIYLTGKMAVRTEVNMFIRPDGVAEVTGEIQRDLLRLG